MLRRPCTEAFRHGSVHCDLHVLRPEWLGHATAPRCPGSASREPAPPRAGTFRHRRRRAAPALALRAMPGRVPYKRCRYPTLDVAPPAVDGTAIPPVRICTAADRVPPDGTWPGGSA